MDAEAANRLRVVVARLARDLNAVSTDEGLTPTQASVLALVAGNSPIGLAELTRLESLNPTMLSRVVGKLVSMGLVERVPDPADMRAAKLSITREGRRVRNRIRDERAKIISLCMERLPKASLDKVVRALDALEDLALEVRAMAQTHQVG